jgi:putative ABC transport system ATP-binding protein
VELIQLSGVSKVYSADGVPVTALHPTDLVISEGEFTCIAGPSGSGKTTLLNLIGGIDTPTQGTVSIAGRKTTGMSRSKAAYFRLSRIGFIFQAHNLIPVLSAYENVEYVLLIKGVAASERRKLVMDALAGVGLAGILDKRPNQMSGGEQQRVAVARAIVASPSIVLADEPTASLDSATGAELVRLLSSLSEREGTTFVFSSHDPKIIECAERVLTLHDGSMTADVRR